MTHTEAQKNLRPVYQDEIGLLNGINEDNQTDPDFTVKDMEHRSFEDLIMVNYKLSELVFKNCTFNSCQMDGIDLAHTRFVDCHFEGCDLYRASLHASYFTNCTFKKCAMPMADFSTTVWTESEMTDCNLTYAIFRNSHFIDSTIYNNRFAGVLGNGTSILTIQLHDQTYCIVKGELGCLTIHTDEHNKIAYSPEDKNLVITSAALKETSHPAFQKLLTILDTIYPN